MHVNDENGETYVRMGPGNETVSIPESSGGSDLHVIREESFTGNETVSIPESSGGSDLHVIRKGSLTGM